MELFISIVNLIILAAVTVGVYKNKIDTGMRSINKVADIDIRLTRLEEKVNFIYVTLKQMKNEKH